MSNPPARWESASRLPPTHDPVVPPRDLSRFNPPSRIFMSFSQGRPPTLQLAFLPSNSSHRLFGGECRHPQKPVNPHHIPWKPTQTFMAVCGPGNSNLLEPSLVSKFPEVLLDRVGVPSSNSLHSLHLLIFWGGEWSQKGVRLTPPVFFSGGLNE